MALNYERAANTLFGNTATPPPDDTVAAAPNHAADVLHGAGAAGAWSQDPVERELFGHDHQAPQEMFSPEVALRPVMAERLTDVMTILQVPQAARVERHREFAEAIRASGLDPNTTGAALYNLQVDSEIAQARGEVAVPDNDGEPLAAALPPRMVEDVLRSLGAWLGPERGEKLVGALNAYLAAQPGLSRILSTPGITARADFRPALDQIIEHVRKTEHI